MDNLLKIAQWKRALKKKEKDLAEADGTVRSNYAKKGNERIVRIHVADVIRIKHEIASLERDIARLEAIDSGVVATKRSAAAVSALPRHSASGAITAPTSKFFDRHMAAAVTRAIEHPDRKEFVADLNAYMAANGTRPTPFAGSQAFKNAVSRAITPEKEIEQAKALEASLRAKLAAEEKSSPSAVLATRLASITGKPAKGGSRRLKSKRNKRTRRHVRRI